MSKTNNVTDFMTDLAMAIRAKEGGTSLISPQDMAQRIGAIGGKEIAKQERSNLTALLTDVADALRAVYGTTDAINPQDFASLVAGISVGESYTPLTYIEATGAQYINTGYVVQEDDVIEMTYISTSATSADKMLFGCMDDNGRIWFSIFSNKGYARFGSTSSATVTNGRLTYQLTLKKQSVVIGNGNSATPNYDALPQVPLYLFGRYVEGTGVGMYGYCRCLSFSIKKSSGEVVMNMRPCKRDSDGKVGMIDLISGNFYANEGAGADFVAGAEARMSDDYEAIPYVEFNKDKLYDIGVVNDKYTIDVMFKRSESSTSPYLYGCLTSDNKASVSAYLTSGGYWRYGAGSQALNTNNTNINRTIISNGKSEYNFTSGTFTASTFTTPYTVVLGGCRSASNTLYKYYIGNIYFIRINEGDVPIIDYYPCRRKSDGVEGFWNCVSQKFVEPMNL